MAGEPAPELELAVDPERLAAEPELKPHALFAHPHAGGKAAADQDLGQIGVAAILGQPAHIVEILLLGIGAEIDVFELGLVHVGDQPGEVLAAVIDDPERAAGKGRIAAALVLGRHFEHQHRGAVFTRRQRGAGRGIAGPDHDHVELFASVDFHRPTSPAIPSRFRQSVAPGPAMVNLQRKAARSVSEQGITSLLGRSGGRVLWPRSLTGKRTARRG